MRETFFARLEHSERFYDASTCFVLVSDMGNVNGLTCPNGLHRRRPSLIIEGMFVNYLDQN